MEIIKLKVGQAFILSLSLILLSGCFKTEEAVEPFPRGEVSNNRIEMGGSYADQYYFSLSENKVVKQIPKTLWDIAFGCDPDSPIIRLNAGKNMYAAGSGTVNFEEVTDTSGLNFKWDWGNGKSDSTALSDWDKSDQVWVINLGLDESANSLGFVKMKVSKEGSNWKIQYANLESNNIEEVSIPTNNRFNHVYYSFITEQIVDAEPEKSSYDLVFRQYIFYFEPEDLAYLVVGSLMNPYQTRVSKVFDVPFEDISLSDTTQNPFSNNLDQVGYDWKEFILSSGVYVVYANQCYILQDANGFYYKFHFTDYYSTSGERGYPVIEFKQL